jgi:O-acetyl-ADP-ribose deacetylase (regulator of RNase III)
VAEELGAASVAVPAVSAGVYGWEAADVASVAVATVRSWEAGRPNAVVDQVRFVLFSDPLFAAFTTALAG